MIRNKLVLLLLFVSAGAFADPPIQFHNSGNPVYDNDLSNRFVIVKQVDDYPDILIDTKTGCEFFTNIGANSTILFAHSCDPKLISDKFKNK